MSAFAWLRAGLRRCTDAVANAIPRSRGSAHEWVLPGASYAPWNADAEFRALWRAVRRHTLIDRYRAYELYRIGRQTAALGAASLEVGVWRGGSGALLAAAARRAGSRAPVYLCDTFAGVVKTGDMDTAYSGGEHADTAPSTVAALLASLQLDGVEILRGVFPDETGAGIAGERFGLCHIDVDVYASARDVYEWIWPRLVPGGVIVYDDYGFITCPGVTQHVAEVAHGPDRLFLHNLNGHAVLVKLPARAA
jgi:O-methyltransferase